MKIVVFGLRDARKPWNAKRAVIFANEWGKFFWVFFFCLSFFFADIIYTPKGLKCAGARCFWVDAIILDEVWNSGNNPTNDDLNLYDYKTGNWEWWNNTKRRRRESWTWTSFHHQSRDEICVEIFIICKYISQER